MTRRALLVHLGHLGSVVLREDALVVTLEPHRRGDFVTRLQEDMTRAALVVVLPNRLAESQITGSLLAEDDHVDEIIAPCLDRLFNPGGLTEDAAGGEDLRDGTDDHLGSRGGKVTRIVLEQS